MSSQYIRIAEVVIGKSGSGLSVKNMRIQFQVTKTVERTPNNAVIKLYNLHPDNESKIKNEYDEVLLNAGYEDSSRLIFRGNIKHVYHYRDKNDHITEIECGDGDSDFRNAVVNKTLAAGSDTAQLIDAAIASFNSTVKGHIGISGPGRLRGRVLSGNTRDLLSDIAREAGASWSIQDGRLVIVKAEAVMPGQAIVINATTGMLNAPEVNDKGIMVKCLLNPQIAVNGAIKLDNNNIMLKLKHGGKLGQNQRAKKAEKPPVRLDPDGIYKVISLQHKGDTRGNDWFTEIICIGLQAPIPVNEEGMAGIDELQ